MGRVLWMPERLRAFGVTVREVPGWQTRGADTLNPKVVIAHHTANPNRADAPSLKLVTNGRSDLPGPLCQILLSRSGIAYLVASGKANHAGAGGWKGVSYNTAALGIEAENDGVGEPWPAVQLEAYARTCAALLSGIGRSADWLCGHKEWAPTRKIDPRGIDMGSFRTRVGRLLTNAPEPTPELTRHMEAEAMDRPANKRPGTHDHEVWDVLATKHGAVVDLPGAKAVVRSVLHIGSSRPDNSDAAAVTIYWPGKVEKVNVPATGFEAPVPGTGNIAVVDESDRGLYVFVNQSLLPVA